MYYKEKCMNNNIHFPNNFRGFFRFFKSVSYSLHAQKYNINSNLIYFNGSLVSRKSLTIIIDI